MSSFWDQVDEEVKKVANGLHHAAKVAKPHLDEAQASLDVLDEVPGPVGKVAQLGEVGLTAFGEVLAKLDELFQKLGAPPTPPTSTETTDPAPAA